MKRSIPGTRVPPDIFPVITHLSAYVGARPWIGWNRCWSNDLNGPRRIQFGGPWKNVTEREFSVLRDINPPSFCYFTRRSLFPPTVFFFSPFLFNFLSHRPFDSLSTEKPLVQREWLISSTAGFIAFQSLLSTIDVFIILRLCCSWYVALER